MKTLKFIVLSILLLSTNIFVQAQDHSKLATQNTESIKVSGNCDMCKARIEKAAKIDGVNKAEWSDETKLLTLVYNPAIVSSDVVQKKIAAAGHDTEKIKADESAYNKLPGCCKYR
jgi:mercuric ion binding protein